MALGFRQSHRNTAHRLRAASGMLAASVFADSAVEHYRGSFENRAMYAPLLSSALNLVASALGAVDHRPHSSATRNAIYAAADLVGIVGGAYHICNVGKRPGGWSWLNIFYGAPLGTPFALLLSGLLGHIAERVRDEDMPRIAGVPAGRITAALSSLAMFGTVAEAAVLHYRGAYQDLYMVLPVIVPPVAAGLLANVAVAPCGKRRWFTRGWLRLTAMLGFAGVGFHVYGVSRSMGGWRNWSQNVLDGPPIPAPPSFTGLALAGLAALSLLGDKSDA